MPLPKPPGIESDPFKSAKWDELTAGRDLSEADAPALSLFARPDARRRRDQKDGARRPMTYQQMADIASRHDTTMSRAMLRALCETGVPLPLRLPGRRTRRYDHMRLRGHAQGGRVVHEAQP
ncbi:hypothetical protein [Olsenella sp. HMSC062G07]|uniref:hypothetical protein n=1 Tax=Olsenella sp. HMSC062G07 TaxID=1739330 RepID=UPI0008A121C6|nr:hypothetical protein [Olsenella sp. HMSC062G07]OFK24219.1 hypothetical protein HMPREF2826_08110 [Olsenella sp. HMSC062G07]